VFSETANEPDASSGRAQPRAWPPPPDQAARPSGAHGVRERWRNCRRSSESCVDSPKVPAPSARSLATTRSSRPNPQLPRPRGHRWSHRQRTGWSAGRERCPAGIPRRPAVLDELRLGSETGSHSAT